MITVDRTLHVVHLIGSTGLYGAERWILALMRATDAQTVRSTLINLVDAREGRLSDVVQAARERGLEAMDFATGGKFNLLAAIRLARWVREQQVDIVHGHGYKSDIIGLLTAKIAGCRIITTPHGWSKELDFKLKFYELLDRWAFRFMDKVCPLSPYLADELNGFLHKEKVKLILNGVDIDEIQSVKPKVKENADDYVIGYIGQIIERKDLDTLISAFTFLANKERNLRLVIIGDGALRIELEARCKKMGISELVAFKGYRSDASAWYNTFDLFVLPSRLEGIPRCVMEALACGVPVIASDIPGNRDLIVHGKTGLLFTVGDIQQLIKNIEFMKTHRFESRQMAEHGRDKIEKEHSSRLMAFKYATLYVDMLSNSHT